MLEKLRTQRWIREVGVQSRGFGLAGVPGVVWLAAFLSGRGQRKHTLYMAQMSRIFFSDLTFSLVYIKLGY
jgi:hypothetical protein